MTNDEIITLAIENTIHGLKFDEEGLLRFAKLVAQHERSACAYRAGIALLGADRGLSNRVDQAIKAALEANDEPVQVSPLQFVEMVMEKEDCIGKPIFWAEWPNKE